MQISILARDFKPRSGGVAEYTYNMARELSKVHEVNMILPHDNKSEDINEDYNSYKVIGKRDNLGSWLSGVYSLPTRVVNSDVFMSNCITGDPLFGQFLAFLGGARFGTFVFAQDVIEDRGRLANIKRLITLKRCDFLIAISKFAKRNIKKYNINEDIIEIIEGGVKLDEFKIKKDISSEVLKSNIKSFSNIKDKKVIFSMGRLVKRKGFDKVIESLKGIINNCGDVVYVLGGEGPDEGRLKSISKRMGVSDSVIFEGYIPEGVRKYYYHVADVFAMPCREENKGDIEGFGIVFTEANACGTPVVGGRSGGATEAVEDGVTGYLVDPLDVDEIAAALTKILINPELGHKLGRQGERRVHDKLNWSVLGERARNFFEKL